MIFSTSFLLATLFAAASQAQLARCPTADELTSTTDGSIYAICQQTDYQGNTAKAVSAVATLFDCIAACNRDGQCTKAVYDKTQFMCYLKAADGLNWASSTAYTTIRFSSKPTTGSMIKTCPTAETNVTMSNGAILATCPNTDYQGNTLQAIGNVASAAACATACGSTAGCERAVYQTGASQCYLKDKPSVLNWIYNPGFQSVRSIAGASAAPPPSTGAVAANGKGRWSAVIQFPIIPVAAYVVPADPAPARLLVFSSYGARAFSGPTGITQFADYNFNTGAVSQRTITNTKHDMFCPGISSIVGGKIVINGGENAEAVSIYDPATNAFTRAADMKIARGYQTSATLSDGRVFTIGGSFTGPIGGKTGEVYDPKANTWTLLPGTNPTPLLTTDREGPWRTDNHAWLYSWRNGSVFQAGPSKAMNWYSTSGTGSVGPAGTRTNVMDQMCGVNVMYDVGKILSAGGSQDYTDSPSTKMTHRISITDPRTPATVEQMPNMNFARGFANGVVLPSGHVIVTGGQLRSLVFTDIDSVLVPEMWDPVTRVWTQLAPAAVPRNYHSVSILLPDGTVFVGGGGMCPAAQGDNLSWCDRAKDHFDGEIFSPPYLFSSSGALATRPVITSVSATNVIVGATIKVVMKDGLQGATFAMVRMGSATHSINSDQRRVSLGNALNDGTGSYTIRLPNDSGVLIPGPWYLFAMSKEGVPSMARTMRVGT